MRPKCSLTWLKVLSQQVAGFQVDLVDGVFQRLDGLVQVGVLRVQEGLALARAGQLVQRRQVDGAQRVAISRLMRSISPAGPTA
jgi:hypothetical protein